LHSIAIKNILHRFFYEIYLSRFLNKNDILLCFGNLPPMLKHKCKTYVYLQNKFIISNENFYVLKYKQKVKNFFLRFICYVILSTFDDIVKLSIYYKFISYFKFAL
jgi:hypothetical protein